jgi:hypothetical protein
MKRSFAAWILAMTPSSSFATHSASRRLLIGPFSSLVQFFVLARMVSSSLRKMRRIQFHGEL